LKHHEDAEQAALFEWASYFPVLDYMFAVPNGAHLAGNNIQRAKQMARLKKQGLKPGVSDIFIPLPMPPYHGLFIELKRADGKGQLSGAQRAFGEYVEAQGYKFVVCEGAQAAIREITGYAKL